MKERALAVENDPQMSSARAAGPASLFGGLGTAWRSGRAHAFLRGSAASFIIRVCGVGLRFAIGVVLARLLGASAFGHYAYAVTWLVALSIPAMLGLDHVLVRFVPAYFEKADWGKLRGVMRFSWGMGGASALIVAASAALVVFSARGLESEARMTMLVTLAAVPLVVLSQIQQALMRALHMPGAAQIPEHVIYPGILLLVLLAAWARPIEMTAPLAAALNAGAWMAALAAGLVWLKRRSPNFAKMGAAPALDEKSAWLSMIPGLVAFNFAYQLMSRAPVLLMGFLATSRDVGIYTVASRGAEFAEFIYGAATLAGGPLFATLLARRNKKDLQDFTSLMAKTIFLASLPVVAGLFIFAPAFLRLFGAEFVSGVGVMRILLAVFFLTSLSGFTDVMLFVAGQQKMVAKVMGLLALLNIGLCWLLIPRWGAVGAALASGASVLLLKGFLAAQVYRKIGVVSFPFFHSGGWKLGDLVRMLQRPA